MEAELIALDTTCIEVEWLKELLSDIPLISQSIPSILINCDSRAAIGFCKKKLINSKLNGHFKRRQKSIKQNIKNEIVTIQHVRSENNFADCLTKGLNRTKVLSSLRGWDYALKRFLAVATQFLVCNPLSEIQWVITSRQVDQWSSQFYEVRLQTHPYGVCAQYR
jgi:hypothetical protein